MLTDHSYKLVDCNAGISKQHVQLIVTTFLGPEMVDSPNKLRSVFICQCVILGDTAAQWVGWRLSSYIGSAGRCYSSVSLYFCIYVSTFSSFLFQFYWYWGSYILDLQYKINSPLHDLNFIYCIFSPATPINYDLLFWYEICYTFVTGH